MIILATTKNVVSMIILGGHIGLHGGQARDNGTLLQRQGQVASTAIFLLFYQCFHYLPLMETPTN
jgi:hypothetical protein